MAGDDVLGPLAAWTTPRFKVGSKYKYIEMLSRFCTMQELPAFPEYRYHDFAVMLGYHSHEYEAIKESGVPYLFIAADLFGMRWAETYCQEQECVVGAQRVLTNSEDLASWMGEEYGVEDATVVPLRPLERDLDFEPLPKLEGRNLVYAGGMVADSPKYSYRDYRELFAALIDAGWTVHCYPGWGHSAAVSHYEALGCVMHDPVPQSEVYRELSQYQAGFQGYAHGDQQHYIEAARPNKLRTYLGAGIPTLGFNAGRGGQVYDGRWGVVARSLDDLADASERVLAMEVDVDVRAAEVMDADEDVFEAVVDEMVRTKPISVGHVAPGNYVGQTALVPKTVRERSTLDVYGFSERDHRFAYTPDDHGVSRSWLKDCDLIQFEVTHRVLDKFDIDPGAGLIVYQHGHMDRPGDAPRSELDLDRERGVTRVVSTLNLLDYVDEDSERWMPCVLDPRVLDQERIDGDDDRVLVTHSPSKRSIKQTEDIIAAVGLLQALGDPVDLDVIEGVPLAECLERKARGDIFFDSLDLVYGMSSVEAMYMGIPVLTGLDDATHGRVGDIVGYYPYVRAHHHDLALRLHELIADGQYRAEMAERGRRYAREWHTPDAVAQRRAALYRTVLATKVRRQTLTPLSDPVRLGVEVAYDGNVYAKGTPIPLAIAREMKAAGVLTDSRL